MNWVNIERQRQDISDLLDRLPDIADVQTIRKLYVTQFIPPFSLEMDCGMGSCSTD